MLQIVVAIYMAALLSQSSRFVEYDFVDVNVTSRVDRAVYVTGCQYTLKPLINRYQQVGSLYAVGGWRSGEHCQINEVS